MKVFIDGSAGTTGLEIRGRLDLRRDVELISLPEDLRKDESARREALNKCDVAFLCLPDDAARAAAALVENPDVRVIDASTAHRTAEGWDYGLAELGDERYEAIARSRRVSNPGCHATGFITAVYPLVKLGLIPPDHPLTCFSLTGYSGGGKSMIADYRSESRPAGFESPRIYGLTLRHKHLPEMTKHSCLTRPPVFLPVVADYYRGMATTVELHGDMLGLDAGRVFEALSDFYKGRPLISVERPEGSMIDANAMAGCDSLKLMVYGEGDRLAVTALFDNLGKGASGAAVQNMNIMMGINEAEGLTI